MPVFACRLNPPRPDFARTLSAEEAVAMGEHARYWNDLFKRGTAVVVGPVSDPAGFWGLAVVDVAELSEANRITESDPAILADVGLSYDILPIPQALVRPLSP